LAVIDGLETPAPVLTGSYRRRGLLPQPSGSLLRPFRPWIWRHATLRNVSHCLSIDTASHSQRSVLFGTD